LSLAVTLAAAGTASQETVTAAGTPLNTGAVVSLTVMVWLQLALLPLLSVAVQLRVITLLQLEPGTLWLSLKLTATTPSQLSVAVTLAAAGTALEHCTLAVAAGQPLNTGASRSTTITCCVQVAALPQASVAVQTTRLVPVGNTLGALLTTVGVPPQLSVAVALPSTTLVTVQAPTSALVSTSAGQLISGAVVSWTTIVWVALAALPHRSLAVQVRVITLLQLEPGALWCSLKFTTGLGSQLSLAVTLAAAGTALEHW
jgi:hypothetical protein